MTRQQDCPPIEDGGPDVATRTAAPAIGNVTRPRRAEDGYTPPTVEDRYEAWVLAEAQNFGYQLSCRCLDCGRPLIDKASVKRRRGRVCRERAGVTE